MGSTSIEELYELADKKGVDIFSIGKIHGGLYIYDMNENKHYFQINYVKQAFIDDPVEYIYQQLESHRGIYEIIKLNVSSNYESLSSSIEKVSSVKNTISFIPVKYSNLVKIITFLVSKLTGVKSVETLSEEMADVLGDRVNEQGKIKLMMLYGRDYFNYLKSENEFELNDDQVNDLSELSSLCDKIAFSYKRLSDIYKNRIKSINKLVDILDV